MDDRCTGHCCRLFPLNFTPAELLRVLWAADAWVRSGGASGWPAHLVFSGWRPDFPVIFRMARYRFTIPVGQPRPIQFGDVGDWDGKHRHYYSCDNLLPNGDCAIYADRPKMCRDFPYGGPCRVIGCTWADQSLRLLPGPEGPSAAA